MAKTDTKGIAISASYEHIHKWSNPETWGGDFPPQNEDSVYIPHGMSVEYDVEYTGVLGFILVEGKLIFKSESDPMNHRHIEANYIYVNDGGVF
jgi:hypothetical protein